MNLQYLFVKSNIYPYNELTINNEVSGFPHPRVIWIECYVAVNARGFTTESGRLKRVSLNVQWYQTIQRFQIFPCKVNRILVFCTDFYLSISCIIYMVLISVQNKRPENCTLFWMSSASVQTILINILQCQHIDITINDTKYVITESFFSCSIM